MSPKKPKFLCDDDRRDKPTFAFAPCAEKTPFVLSDSTEEKIQVPGTISQYLRDYQREGIKFIYSHYKKNEGAILGDDMGLGKTIQVIAFLSAVLGKTGSWEDKENLLPALIRKDSDPNFKEREPICFLIIAPASILYNWMDEFETWGYFSVACFHKELRRATLNKAKNGRAEVVLTSFETARDYVGFLNNINWAAIFVDEVHRVKEPKARVTVSLKQFKCQRRYGLTGTALQNNLKELWCILDWANPNCLGDTREFMEEYASVIEKGQRRKVTKRDLAEARKKKGELESIVKIWMIRRTKSCISDQLPKKTDRVILCRPSLLQSRVYKAILNMKDVKWMLQQWDMCPCGKGLEKGKCCFKQHKSGRSVKALTFSTMHLLLKAANHLGMLSPSIVSPGTQATKAAEIWHAVAEDSPGTSQNDIVRTISKPKQNGKMLVLAHLLQEFSNRQDKVLLFSYSTTLLNILEQYIETLGYIYRRIDGNTKLELRGEYVKEFNTQQQIFLFLISTKAGGLGLNITGANVVIIFDPNWNPAHDLQAQDRAYRIGQRRDVSVYRLITCGTIEENMYLRQVYKQQLGSVAVESENSRRYFQGVQGDKTRKGELFGIKNMFGFRSGEGKGAPLTEEILKRHWKLEENIHQSGKEEDLFIVADCQVMPEEEHFDDTEGDKKETAADDPYGLQDQFVDELSSPAVSDTKKRRARLHEMSSSDESDNDVESSQDINAIDKLLDSSQVVHTHLNQEVVGSSKAEDHISRCAAKSVFELNTGSQELAMHCDPMEEPIETMPEFIERSKEKLRAAKKRIQRERLNAGQVINLENDQVHYGETPKAVKRKHLMEMAEEQGIPVEALATKILQMSTTEKVHLLENFYTRRFLGMEKFFNELSQQSKEIPYEVGDSIQQLDEGPSTSQPRVRGKRMRVRSIPGVRNEEDTPAMKKNGKCTSQQPKVIDQAPPKDACSRARKDTIASDFLDSLLISPGPKPAPKSCKRKSDTYNSSGETPDTSFGSRRSTESACSEGAAAAFSMLDQLFFS